MGVGGQTHAPAASTPGKESVPIVQEGGWAPGPVWTGGKSRPHWESIPDRPARSQSLYRLSYPANWLVCSSYYIMFLSYVYWENKTLLEYSQGQVRWLRIPGPWFVVLKYALSYWDEK